MSATRNVVPNELRGKFPPISLTFYERPVFVFCFGTWLTFLALHGPFFGENIDHNGFRYLLGPIICPLVPALYHIFIPLHPYKNLQATWAGMENLDKKDLDARRLVDLLRSKMACRVILQSTVKSSFLLFIIMAFTTFLYRKSLNWSFSSTWLFPGLVGGCIGSFISLWSNYLGWGLKNWSIYSKNQEVT